MRRSYCVHLKWVGLNAHLQKCERSILPIQNEEFKRTTNTIFIIDLLTKQVICGLEQTMFLLWIHKFTFLDLQLTRVNYSLVMKQMSSELSHLTTQRNLNHSL